MDIFDELEDMVSMSLPAPPSSPTSTHSHFQLYYPPKHPYAFAIWLEAKIPMTAQNLADIEYSLVKWSIERKYMQEKEGITYIIWKTKDISFTAEWSVFLKWFLTQPSFN